MASVQRTAATRGTASSAGARLLAPAAPLPDLPLQYTYCFASASLPPLLQMDPPPRFTVSAEMVDMMRREGIAGLFTPEVLLRYAQQQRRAWRAGLGPLAARVPTCCSRCACEDVRACRRRAAAGWQDAARPSHALS